VDADTGRIVAAALTGREVDDGAEVGFLLDQVEGPVASFTDDGGYDQDRVYAEVAAHGRPGWQKRSGYGRRSRAEAAIGRWKRVIGDGLRSRKDERRATEVAVAVHSLNRMLELGRPIYVRVV